MEPELSLQDFVHEHLLVFVEVKSPGWEGELSDKERRAGRAKQPKYQPRGGGAFGNWQPLQKCIASAKTYPKFAPTQPNLLIVADDLMVSLPDSIWHVEIGLYADHTGYGEMGYFTSSRFENLGGVGGRLECLCGFSVLRNSSRCSELKSCLLANLRKQSTQYPRAGSEPLVCFAFGVLGLDLHSQARSAPTVVPSSESFPATRNPDPH